MYREATTRASPSVAGRSEPREGSEPAESAEPRLMNTDTLRSRKATGSESTDRGGDMDTGADTEYSERLGDVRATYRELGYPPSARQVAERRPHTAAYYRGVSEEWDDILRAAGVPTRRGIVTEWIQDRHADRYPWEDTIRFRATVVADETCLNGRKVGNVLQRISDEELSGGIVVARYGSVSNSALWEIQGGELA